MNTPEVAAIKAHIPDDHEWSVVVDILAVLQVCIRSLLRTLFGLLSIYSTLTTSKT
jgi:hypothetical protein